MSRLTVFPTQRLRGEITLPGDKSISHRAALLAALADGESRIQHFLDSGVTRVLLNALRALGVEWVLQGETLTVQGREWRTPAAALDCGNSATTLRLLAGALAARNTAAVLDGSAGLRRRPMGRIVQPLREMGVSITASDDEYAPLIIEARPGGIRLNGGTQRLAVASAQVKSCLLLAGLAANRPHTVIEPHRSRDHTERLLSALGVQIEAEAVTRGWAVRVHPVSGSLPPLRLSIPGDLSAGAFWAVAAAITPGSQITLRGVGLNPGRTGLLEALREMGASLTITPHGEQGGEPASVEFCYKTGLTYVSCSPFRVPIARLAAAQAAIKGEAKVAKPAAKAKAAPAKAKKVVKKVSKPAKKVAKKVVAKKPVKKVVKKAAPKKAKKVVKKVAKKGKKK